MKLLAILFVLPAALLRRVRKTKPAASVCDDFDGDHHDKDNKVMVEGCLDLFDKCRLFVIPRLWDEK